MSGEYSPEYLVARTALLDALEALGPHRQAVILVGAQAIYAHTGDAGLAVAEYTTDGDLALDPLLVPADPELAAAMRSMSFYREDKGSGPEIGIWSSLREVGGVAAIVKVDLLMPEAVAGTGRRSAHVGSHEKGSVRRVRGLEGCLVDRSALAVSALDATDTRSFEIMVAGPAALLVGKLIKIAERSEQARAGQRDRTKNKDALDVLRLLRAIKPHELALSLDSLANNPVSAEVAQEALAALPTFFGTNNSSGSLMAADAAFPESPDVIAASCAALATELLNALADLG